MRQPKRECFPTIQYMLCVWDRMGAIVQENIEKAQGYQHACVIRMLARHGISTRLCDQNARHRISTCLCDQNARHKCIERGQQALSLLLLLSNKILAPWQGR